MTPVQQPALTFPPTKVTTPSVSDDPIGWACAYLEEKHGAAVYRKFRDLVDDRLKREPTAVMSADQVMHVIRWFTDTSADGDTFAVNNVATALFTRLYVLEHPTAVDNFRTRRSKFDLDAMDSHDRERLLLAFEPLRVNRRRYV